MSEDKKDMSETPHITALRRQDKLNRQAKERFRVANGKVEKYKAGPPAQDIDEIAAADKLANPAIGDLVPGKGVFLGLYTPVDTQGNSLRKTFNIYAAPENLTDKAGNKTFSYGDALKNVAALGRWHGHAGTSYKTDKEILTALEDGSYAGGWFIPPRSLLMGKNSKGEYIQPDNLFSHADKGSFKGSFRMAGSKGIAYWSSTRHPNMPYMSFMMAVRLPGGVGCFYPESPRFACRPVRLELRP